MRIVWAFGLASLLILVGCVPSLHELYTRKTLVFDPSLAGRWQQDDDEAIWEFKPDAANKVYTVTIRENKDTTSTLTAHLVDIKGQRFFDFYPAAETEIQTGDWIKAHLIAAHLFLQVHRTEPNLVLSIMAPEAVGKLLKDKPEMVKHEWVDDRVVLTDGPAALQAFVTAGLKIDGFFSEPVSLKRIPAEKKTEP